MSDTTSGPVEVPGGAVRISTEAPAEQTRVVLYYLGDEAHTVPKTLSGGQLLRMMEISVTDGGGAAMLWALQQGVGMEAYRALTEAAGMTEENVADVLRRVEELYLPQAERLGKAPRS